MTDRPHSDDLSTVVQQKLDPLPIDATFVLRVTSGPDLGSSFVVRGAEPPVLVGQSSTCVVRLRDRLVSRRHASLEVSGDVLRVVDLSSSNGTFVDRVAIDGARLKGGETLRFGDTTLIVTRGAADPDASLPPEVRFGRLFGASREMRRLYPLLQRLAASDVPVVIEGETGTGKEVLAESLHDESKRAGGPFVVFDCTAVPASLAEAEIFGHERGAFTGALAQRKGFFEQAHGGTLFIDEIGDLDLPLQPKLLRAVERGEIRRVGGDRWIHIDLRIVAATRRDLDREVQEGRFRDDLFHRLAVGRVALPPLRERRGDVAQLAQRFWKDLGGDARGVEGRLLARWEKMPWPGNVRELRNVVARTLALGDLPSAMTATSASGAPAASTAPAADASTGELLTDFLTQVVDSRVPLIHGRELVVDEYERRYVERVLDDHGGNVVHAARASGIARRHFQRIRARLRRT